MRKMNIVQILPEMEEGGVEGETLDFAGYLAEKKHQSFVISAGGRLVPQLEKMGVTHVTWPHIGEKSLRCLKYINKLRKFYRDERIDIIHLRSRLPAWLGYLAWKMTPANQRPLLITTFHGFYSINAYSAIMTKGELVIAVSQVIKDHIQENYGLRDEKLGIVHGGCDMDLFDPEKVSLDRMATLRENWGVAAEGPPVILLPGRLTRWKGQSVFIESLANLNHISFQAICVGEIDEGSEYVKELRSKIVKYQLDKKVKLVGHCTDIPAALLIADLVVSASSSQPEAFGKIAIEAMAMGKPVVSTRHGGSLETVVENETGWFVAPDNHEEMAATLEKVLNNPQLVQEAGEKGRQRVKDHFTAERMCEKTLSLYGRAIHDKQSSRS